MSDITFNDLESNWNNFENLFNIHKEDLIEWKYVFEKLDQHKIPDDYSKIKQNRSKSIFNDNTLPFSTMYVRDLYVQKCGFPLLSKDWIKPLSKWIGNRKCLEVMSGTGAFAKSLQDYGISVLPTDNKPWKNNLKWTEVIIEDAVKAVKKYGNTVDIIIMSWPPYNNPIANQVLLTMREVNPDTIMLYIGEYGGCTADDIFFENAKFIEDETFDSAVKDFLSFYGIHDQPYLIK